MPPSSCHTRSTTTHHRCHLLPPLPHPYRYSSSPSPIWLLCFLCPPDINSPHPLTHCCPTRLGLPRRLLRATCSLETTPCILPPLSHYLPMLLDVVSVFNEVSSLAQKKQSIKITQDGIE
ncbi:hypothetical protein BVRB_007820 [Beta vulgaris subsp. vulgaris]|uniref:Uncharacterized protein n=1 Tax=Beta vulgaris subsp. vulgaris TaxID=3555 RepID=A0A0J8B6S2_BETVV|nr:hypothetical protein BVRB_007820 [Beta vulgaris subsp. vulgaris]